MTSVQRLLTVGAAKRTTLTATRRLLGTMIGYGSKGGRTRYCGHRASLPGWRRATARFPIIWTGGTDPERLNRM